MSFILMACILTLYCCSQPPEAPAGVTYTNPRVYNVHYEFHLSPDSEELSQLQELKVWIPFPRKWESQQYVNLLNATPTPHGEYSDPEHGNCILFWDLSRESDRIITTIKLEFRLEAFEIHGAIDPETVLPYEKDSWNYRFYTRSSPTIDITPEIEKISREITSSETNPYQNARRIFSFVKENVRFSSNEAQIGRGTGSLLSTAVTNSGSGKVFYKGTASQHAIFFVSLCRAAGIPARTVQGTLGFIPSITEKDLKLSPDIILSPAGLGGARYWVSDRSWGIPVMRPLTWAEFYIQDHGWVPVDFFHDFGSMDNWRTIISKGTDILIGPEAPNDSSYGYGTQWVEINSGRADILLAPVWNIATFHSTHIKAFHYSDPFPADALAAYHDYKRASADRKIHYPLPRRAITLNSIYNYGTRHGIENLRIPTEYLSSLFLEVVGKEAFDRIYNSYLDLRHTSQEPLTAEKFIEMAENISGDSLGWYFDQWMNREYMPCFQLEAVRVEPASDGWQISGEIFQSGEKLFKAPMEIAAYSDTGRDIHRLMLDSLSTFFQFNSLHKPSKLVLDPDYKIPSFRQMPPRLSWLWKYYSDLILVVGTMGHAKANRSAAELFNNEYLGLEPSIIITDTLVTKEDMQHELVVIFGPPAPETVIGSLAESFPLQIENDRFFWETWYDSPDQGFMQIIENPFNPHTWVIQYAGLSTKAISSITTISTNQPVLSGEQFIWDKERFSAYDSFASYIIFGGDSVLTAGTWVHQGDMVVDINNAD